MQMQRYGWRTIPTWLSQKQRSLRKEGLLWKMVKPRPADSAAVAWTHESCGRMDGNRWERWLSLSVEHAILSLNLGFNRVHWEFFLVVFSWFSLVHLARHKLASDGSFRFGQNIPQVDGQSSQDKWYRRVQQPKDFYEIPSRGFSTQQTVFMK